MNVSAPATLLTFHQFECIEIKRSALFLFAILGLSRRSTVESSVRVKITLTFLRFSSMYFPVFRAIARLIFFSFVNEPIDPGSLPQCPGSMTITHFLSPFIAERENGFMMSAKNIIRIPVLYILMV